ncbi:MAG: tRNA (adenosine(37)-N6)-threonylcarbamoyltransferase complex transferase subunit TsaD [Acidobacteria bacterium]|nr:tRNA (adenosine(37)-N6)-threonylcarbamoyltransferase complex transferase subunit TsaD [Acidobacteriota bacterium]MBU4307990.1 tRNA (adenosine(37)-N6)-threonylcarbamoyltransferase complex transferase subunit TsaD [Acidobacteriota bacterium]MBU4404476.1 tRNA (adenosine(37)-N6)-threonylcarbamoyltransferase complex transferase subunit TsaD [Acidobacteriota bacterium]MCG2810696.1 tRNA (adenosine(37)-N6)-threonylcarbamoyltransferase complex transferase subunit TsaD [Candidatus Aminicenantes bacteri
MYILGIESSCDETAVAVVERGDKNTVRAEQIKSQVDLHAPYGGIVPEIAARTHCETIDLLTRRALQQAGVGIEDIDILALTQGPGLVGSLLIGLAFAKGLAMVHDLPLVAVDHIAAHIESPFISHPEIAYPLLALVVSGGHTALFYHEEKFNGRVIAKTRDDAAGEIMDKVAKHFGLGYPGGPLLDKLYIKGDPKKFTFKIPRMSDGSADFSFSGYKSALLRQAQKLNIQPDSQDFYDLLASFLSALVEYLLGKTLAAAKDLPVRSLIVSGGVSRNSLLRRRFSEECARLGIPLYLAEPCYCTDNAAMIAWLGYEKYQAYPNLNYFDLYLNSYSRAHFRESGKHR